MNLNISRSTAPRAVGQSFGRALTERLRFWRAPALALLVGLATLWPSAAPRAEDEFIPPEQAFKYTLTATADAITVQWTVAKGYYLYRKRLGFEANTPGITLATAVFPKGLDHEDEFFGKQEVYRGAGNRFVLPYTRAANAPANTSVLLKLQGCADAGLCYPPLKWTATVALPAPSPVPSPKAPLANQSVSPSASAPVTSPVTSLAGLKALASASKARSADQKFLPPTEAFRVSATALAADRIRVSFMVEPGYYLYQKRLKAVLKGAPADVSLTPVTWPAGSAHNDEFFGEQTVYPESFEAELALQRGASTGALTVGLAIGLQGCAEAGLCYPPETRQVTVVLPAVGTAPSVTMAPTEGAAAGGSPESAASAAAAAGGTAAAPSGMVSEQDRLAKLVAHGSLWLVLASFFGFGLLLAFTPCVLPMIPILSGIIAGQGEQVTPMRGFLLSLSYVMGMALTYTIAGAAFAAAGQQAQAIFQQPWILGLFALLFVGLALAMFGFYELQLPAGLQTRLNGVSGKLSGGKVLSTALMGALSSLVVTACVAPPLVAALAVISQTGSVLRGGLALFSLSIGMGAPLLVVGASAGKLLPRAGAWMETVKQVFGVLFLGVAVWMAERILPERLVMVLWAGVAGAALWVFWPQRGWRPFGVGLALRGLLVAAALLWGLALLVGAGFGGKDPLRPFEGTRFGPATPQELVFTRIHSVADLDRELAAAKAAGRRVMVDFSAEWCVSCKEMEKYTFRDPAVQAALAPYLLLQADVTANSADDQALLQRFAIFGPPTTAFFGPEGRERTDFRLVGFVAAEPFRAHLARLEKTP